MRRCDRGVPVNVPTATLYAHAHAQSHCLQPYSRVPHASYFQLCFSLRPNSDAQCHSHSVPCWRSHWSWRPTSRHTPIPLSLPFLAYAHTPSRAHKHSRPRTGCGGVYPVTLLSRFHSLSSPTHRSWRRISRPISLTTSSTKRWVSRSSVQHFTVVHSVDCGNDNIPLHCTLRVCFFQL
jgi:hypothetical protein